MDDQVTVTTTNRNKPSLMINGYMYRLDRTSTKAKTWRCTRRDCNARCKTTVDNKNIVFIKEHSDHEVKNEKQLAVDEFRKRCKRRGADDIFERPAKLMRLELPQDNELIDSTDMERVRKAVYQERRKQLPKLPKDRAETHSIVDEQDMRSCRNENMIHVNDAEKGIIIITTKSNMVLLCDRDSRVFGDGTFKTCPRHFLQMYTLHALKADTYVPCVYALLLSKTEQVYIEMFRHVKAIALDYDLELELEQIHLDFEKASHQAVRVVWPNISVKGCHFHLSQAWYRKIASLGLADEYQKPDSEIGVWLKRFFGLSFIEPGEVEECFAFDMMDDTPADARCAAFADYMLRTYIGSDDSEAIFPSELWADPNLDAPRTTNACESFHSHFADLFYHAHPNICEWMDKVKDVQKGSYTKMNTISARAGVIGVMPLRPPSRQARLKRQQMNHIKRSRERETITRKQFVQQMAWKNLPAAV